MTITLLAGGASATQVLPGARSADIQVGQKQIESSPEFTLPAPGSNAGDFVTTPEDRRIERLNQAAQALVGSDPFPISDRVFTIYKDGSGQYVTRYTSLRDGRVTYIPEQRLLVAFEQNQARLREAVLTLNA